METENKTKLLELLAMPIAIVLFGTLMLGGMKFISDAIILHGKSIEHSQPSSIEITGRPDYPIIIESFNNK